MVLAVEEDKRPNVSYEVGLGENRILYVREEEANPVAEHHVLDRIYIINTIKISNYYLVDCTCHIRVWWQMFCA